MRNRMRSYTFARGRAPFKTPDSKRKGLKGNSYPGGWDPNAYREEFKQSLVEDAMQEGYSHTNGHIETALEHGQPKYTSNGHSPLTHVSETPLRGGLDGNRK